MMATNLSLTGHIFDANSDRCTRCGATGETLSIPCTVVMAQAPARSASLPGIDTSQLQRQSAAHRADWEREG